MEFLLIALLTLLNGVFAMSELALASSRKARLQTMASDGEARGRPRRIGALLVENGTALVIDEDRVRRADLKVRGKLRLSHRRCEKKREGHGGASQDCPAAVKCALPDDRLYRPHLPTPRPRYLPLTSRKAADQWPVAFRMEFSINRVRGR
jgi:hypothetical protein